MVCVHFLIDWLVQSFFIIIYCFILFWKTTTTHRSKWTPKREDEPTIHPCIADSDTLNVGSSTIRFCYLSIYLSIQGDGRRSGLFDRGGTRVEIKKKETRPKRADVAYYAMSHVEFIASFPPRDQVLSRHCHGHYHLPPHFLLQQQ